MLKYILKVTLLLGGFFYFAGVCAQNQNTGWTDFSFIKESDIRLTGYNVTGLRYLPVGKISIAEVYANKSNGKFVNYYQSDNSYRLGASAESFYRFNPRIVFYGKVTYDNFTGKNMNGSAFIDPYFNPFDIVEYDMDNRGKKNMETYNLAGAVSADLTERFTVGGKIDYKAANCAKEKDLRHTNKLLDMYLTAGVSYRFTDWFELGASYYYKRSVEGLKFNVYGENDQFLSLIDYGAFLGNLETFGESGYTTKGNEQPMVNEFNGASIQLGFNLSPSLRMTGEVTYKSRKGYFGERSANSVVHSKHNSDIWEGSAMISYRKNRNLHLWKIQLDNEELDNFENVYTRETKPGGISYIEYFDPLKRAYKSRFNTSVEYTANLNVENCNPEWVLKGWATFHDNYQKISMYPYFRRQTIKNTHIGVLAKRNFMSGDNLFSISLGASYLFGNGTEFEDGQYATPSSSQTPPISMDLLLHREFEYLTANQIKADIIIGYSRLLPELGIKGYANLGYSLKKATDIKCLDGSNFNVFNLTVGCSF